MKKVINYLAMALVCLSMVLTACQKPDVSYVTIEEMYFNQAVPTFVDEGQEVNLSSYLMILPVTVADTVSVTWNSSNEEIATVNANGTVQALREGNVTITANAQDKFASLTLRIDKVKITEFTIPAKFEVYVGNKAKFPITDVKPKGTPLHRFKWDADNDGKKPTYSEGNWYLKADEEREYTLTASVDDADDAKCNVKFVKPSVSTLAFNPNAATIEEEGSLSLKSNLQITPADGFKADTVKVVWTSSKESVATIDQNGKVQAIAAGKATITAQAGGKTATCTVEVTAKPAPEDPEDPEKPEDPSEPMDPSDPEIPVDPEKPTFTITFNANGGKGTMESITVKEGESVTLPTNVFTRSSYNFNNWNTRSDGFGLTYNNKSTIDVTSSMVLYAQWVSALGEENGYEWIDLGLPSGTKWATMNVGATSPEDYGDYFAWGETETKSLYSSDNYKYYEQDSYGSYNPNKYCTADKLTILQYTDDAARVNWGGTWRTPSSEQYKELIDNSTYTWTTQKGVEGWLITSNINGNSIFFPAAGLYSQEKFINPDDNGYVGFYWTRTIAPDVFWDYEYANILRFNKESIKTGDYAYEIRFKGFPVRAVFAK